MPDELVNVRYMVDDVEAAIDFYTTHFGFTVRSSAAPAFADVVRGHLRLLLSGPHELGRAADARRAHTRARGWNRIHFDRRRHRRPRSSGCAPRAWRSATTSSSGPGGQQILLDDPAGNPIELFQPATG